MTKIFLSVLGVSVSVSLMIAVLLVLTPFLNKRYAAKWKYWIWVVLALRLIIPFGAGPKQPAANTQSQVKAEAASESEKDHADALAHRIAPRRVIVEIPTQLTTPIEMRAEKTGNGITPLDAAVLVWVFGGMLFIVMHLFSYFHYKRQILKNGTIIKDEAVLGLLSELERELHIKTTTPAVKYAGASSPMIIGFLKHILVLPEEEYGAEELYFIMKHELVHLKRGDVYFKLLFAAANALHWFNPFVWMLQKEASVDMELSCDERVTQDAGYAVRKAYTETLLSALHKQCVKRTVLSTQFYGGKRIMKKRFKNILIRKGKKNGIAILICAVILTVGLGTLVGCSIAKEAPKDSSGRLETEDIPSRAEQPLDDCSVFIGDLSLSIYESKGDILAKLEEAGLDCRELIQADPEEAKFDSCYQVDRGMQIFFLDDICVRLRVTGAGFEGSDEIAHTARGICPESTYSQMVEQYGDSFETRLYVGKETYTLYRYLVDDYICEFGMPRENSDSIYYIDIYASSQFPVFNYGEYLESIEQNGKEEPDSEGPLHIDVTTPSLQEDECGFNNAFI